MRNIWLKGFWRSWQQQTVMQLATLSALAGTFCVISISWIIYRNLDQVLTSWGESVQVSVFLKDDAKVEEISSARKYLENLGEFKEISFLGKDEAAKQFEQQMGSSAPGFLSDPEFGNPLPSSFEAKLRDEIPAEHRYSILVNIVDKITKFAAVEDVYYGQGWVKNYTAVVQSFKGSSWILIFILSVGSLFVIGNSIRNAIGQRSEEIEILELVGATPEMIRIPYVVEGALMGTIASIFSLAICYLLYLWQVQIVHIELSFLKLNHAVSFLSWFDAIIIAFMGAFFGALGAYLCVHRVCNGWSAAHLEEAKW